eukprot:scpid89601/ scgid25293/ 
MDHMLVALHRTALDFLPAYDASLDATTWWASAYMWNMYASALLPKHCSFYRELAVDERAQQHADYPKRRANRDGGDPLDDARVTAGNRLADAGVRDFSRDMKPRAVVNKLFSQLNPYSVRREPCLVHGKGVDYAAVPGISAAAKFFSKISDLQSGA